MLLSFINWNKSEIRSPRPENLERGHYHLYMKSIRGEKVAKKRLQKSSENCPTLETLDTGTRSKEDFLFRNRDYSSMNLIFANEFALDYD